MRRQQEYELDSFGTVRTDRVKYAPLDEVRITFICRGQPHDAFFIEVSDGAGRSYARRPVAADDGVAELTVTAAGTPGLHIIRIFTDDTSSFCPFRMGSFVLEANTTVSAEGADIEGFLTWVRDGLEACHDWARYDGRWVAGD